MSRTAILVRVLVGALFFLPILSVGLVWYQRDRIAENRGMVLPMLGEVGDFSFTESNGKPLGLSDLRGKVWVAGFIFTRCAGTCPIITHNMLNLHKQLPPRDDFRLVSISVDPDHDTPQILAKYATDNHLDRAHWWLITGPKQLVYPWIRNSFRLATDDSSGTPDEPVSHSTKLVLVDRSGQIRGYYDGGDVDSIKKLAHDIRSLIALRS